MYSKKIVLLFIMGIGIIFSSCKNEKPSQTAKEFLDAINAMEFEKAGSLSTEESASMINLLKEFTKAVPDSVKNNKPEILILRQEVQDTTAVVFYQEKSDKKDEKESSINLVKRDGKWLVDYSKKTLGAPSSPEETMDLEGSDEVETGESETPVK